MEHEITWWEVIKLLVKNGLYLFTLWMFLSTHEVYWIVFAAWISLEFKIDKVEREIKKCVKNV